MICKKFSIPAPLIFTALFFSATLRMLPVSCEAAVPASIKFYFTDPLSATTSKSSLSCEDKAIDDALVDYIDSMPSGATAYLAIYEMNIPKIIDAFNSAAARGVTIYAIGYSTGTTPSDSSIYGLVGISTYTRVHTTQFMHNKFVVLKDSAVWTGSFNFTTSALQQDNNAVLIYSKELAQYYEKEFLNMWNTKNFSYAKSTSTVNSGDWNGKEVTVDGVKIKVYFNPYQNAVKNAILTELEGEDRATPPVIKPVKDVYVCMAWITESGVIYTLKNLSGEGLTVCGVLDDSNTNWEAYYSFRNSSATFVFDSRKTNGGDGLLHHKFGVIDPGCVNGRVIMGSPNWSDSGITTSNTSNDENMLIIYSPELSAIYYREFLRLFKATGESVKTPSVSDIYKKAVSSVVVYPSPARQQATIGYELSAYVTKVSVKIYSLSGEAVRELTPQTIYPGLYNEITWDLKNSDGVRVAPGTYFIKVEAETPDGKYFLLKKTAVGK